MRIAFNVNVNVKFKQPHLYYVTSTYTGFDVETHKFSHACMRARTPAVFTLTAWAMFNKQRSWCLGVPKTILPMSEFISYLSYTMRLACIARITSYAA